jgi:hypothetical protein
MLAGTLAVDDYLRPLDVEYPAFSRDMCHLLRELRAKGKKIFQVKHLADEALKTMGDKGHLYGPGDQLTLLYVFHPNLAETRREAFLAARSIIFSKISEKEELTDDLDRFPHLSDELACIRTTQQLGLDDYRRLFPLVRRAKSSDARQLVARHLAEDGKAAGKPEIYVCGEYGSVPGIQWALLSGRQTAEEVLKIMNTNR